MNGAAISPVHASSVRSPSVYVRIYRKYLSFADMSLPLSWNRIPGKLLWTAGGLKINVVSYCSGDLEAHNVAELIAQS
jgi:hypothetical protein